MRPNKMVALCRNALARLDEIEALLPYVDQRQHAFIFRSKPDVHELLRIAKFETVKRVTTEQALHINHICEQLDCIYASLPKEIIDMLDEDD